MTRPSPHRAALLLLAACACAEDPGPGTAAVAPKVVYLEPVDHLVRASMAIRGLRPELEEIDLVREDPSQLEPLVDAYLDSPEFGATVRDLHAELLLLRVDTNSQALLPVYGPLAAAGYSQADLYESAVEAPLRFVEDIVMGNRPYTEVVTAQYTLANQVVADVYGLPYDPRGPEWQYTQWVDGRPHAGLLSDSEVWRRHVSNAQNFHRGRANVVSRTFLCEDIAGRDVVVEGGVDIADPIAVANAVSTNPSCIGCHASLDPLAAYFWGYKEQMKRGAISLAYSAGCDWDFANGSPSMGDLAVRDSYRVDHWCYPLRFYVGSDETLWQDFQLREPAFFGHPAEDLTDMGRLVADDPRFAQCTARNFYAYLTQTPREDIPLHLASELQDVLVDSAFDAKALVRAIVLSDGFRTATVRDDPDHEVFAPGLQVIRPEQYTRTVEALTGFRWVANQDKGGCQANGNDCWEIVDAANSDLFGFRSMMGGVDGFTVTHPTHTVTPTKLLATGMLADEAAGFVVGEDFALPAAERRLLGLVEPTTTDGALVRKQIAWLHQRVLGEVVDVDSDEVAETAALFDLTLNRTGDPAEGWRVVIAALLQDVRMYFY